ncbi:hypothetical protein [Paramicrobacterium agarici]|uniref:hypothetical protein n=1 Tax=Paramicrobacterium agarici TaxID=630514 RepID=UPI001151C3BA|nr:hypothetical protein [Microbacterium agarici]
MVHLVALHLDPNVLAVLVDAQAHEEGFEEVASDVVRCVAVELPRVAEQREVCQRCFCAVAQAIDGAGELLLDEALLQRCLFQLVAEARDSVGSVRGEIDQTFLLSFQLLELAGEAGFGLFVGRKEHVDGLLDKAGEILDRLAVELLRVHELDDLIFE